MRRFVRLTVSLVVLTVSLVVLAYRLTHDNTWFLILVGGVFVDLAIGCIWVFPEKLVAYDTAIRRLNHEQLASAKNSARTTLLQGLVGLVALTGIVFAWYQFRNEQKQLSEQLTLSQQQVALSRQGQMAERFSRAIDQLASTRPEIRLGGVYSLERLAKATDRDEKEENEERLKIYQVLADYIRQHVPNNASSAEKYNRARQPWKNEPLLEVQAILTVLGQRRPASDDPPLNLNYVYLREVSLAGANLQGVDLGESVLGRADLRGAELQNASFAESSLEKADLYGADLQGANLGSALMYGANLGDANLRGAKLCGADLTDAQLVGAHLEGATADVNTTWPSEFNWRQAGVRVSTNYDCTPD
jgi:hypothetical protein